MTTEEKREIKRLLSSIERDIKSIMEDADEGWGFRTRTFCDLNNMHEAFIKMKKRFEESGVLE